MRNSMLLHVFSIVIALLAAAPPGRAADAGCGEVVTITTHDNTTTRYAYAGPQSGTAALVLLPGGGGFLDLDSAGCPRALKGNSLVKSLPHFHALGFATALVDAPSDHASDEGLGGFRTVAAHAQDIGKVIEDMRRRTGAPVWLVGTSRGTISAVNVASRLTGPAAPDGLILTSALMEGQVGARLTWVSQSVFNLELEAIRQPTLLIGHVDDTCARSPPSVMPRVIARINGVREQMVAVTGGPGKIPASGISACEGRAPHGYIEQEAEVAAGMARFIRGGMY